MKSEKWIICCHRRGAKILCRLSFANQGQNMFYQTPSRPPSNTIDQVVSTVTLGWVGDPHQRASFRFQDGVVGFVVRCLPRILVKVYLVSRACQHRGHIHVSRRATKVRERCPVTCKCCMRRICQLYRAVDASYRPIKSLYYRKSRKINLHTSKKTHTAFSSQLAHPESRHD